MSNASRIRRPVILATLACALLGAPTGGGVAAAQPNDDARCRIQLGAGLGFVPCYHDRHKSTPTRSDDSPPLTVARAQERYYSTYGEPEPLTLPQSPAPGDDTPWLPIALALAVAVLLTTTATQVRRLRLRGRAARATT
jgi:hypothetical protein